MTTFLYVFAFKIAVEREYAGADKFHPAYIVLTGIVDLMIIFNIMDYLKGLG